MHHLVCTTIYYLLVLQNCCDVHGCSLHNHTWWFYLRSILYSSRVCKRSVSEVSFTDPQQHIILAFRIASCTHHEVCAGSEFKVANTHATLPFSSVKRVTGPVHTHQMGLANTACSSMHCGCKIRHPTAPKKRNRYFAVCTHFDPYTYSDGLPEITNMIRNGVLVRDKSASKKFQHDAYTEFEG